MTERKTMLTIDQPLKSTDPNGPIVFFATPAYDGMKSWYQTSVINATRDLNAHGFRVQHYLETGCPLITNAREELLGMFLASEAEWMVMIDNDIGFPPDLVRKMIVFGEPMMTAAVPYRSVDVEAIEAGSYSDGITFNVTPDAATLQERENRDGFVRVDSAGTAFIVARRDAVLAMGRRYPELDIQVNHVKSFALFHQFILNRTHVGEDVSFFRRWTMMGGQIWCAIDTEMTHTGIMTVGGNLARKMESSDDPAKRWVKGSVHRTPGTGLPTDPERARAKKEKEVPAHLYEGHPPEPSASSSEPSSEPEPPPEAT